MPPFLKPNLKSTKNLGGYTFTRLQEVKTVSNIDVLFLGSSHAYHGFDTRIYEKKGITSFNLGTSAQTPLQTKFLLSRYLDKVIPKEVVLQVSPFIFAIDGVESTVDIVSNDFVDIQSVALATKLKDINVSNALIYSSFEDFFNKKSSYKEKNSFASTVYVSGGYVESNDTGYRGNQYIITDFEFKKIQLKAFDEIITLLENKGITYHLVYVPITKPLYTSISKQLDFESLMNIYGGYHDFNKILSLDSTYFYDRHHLNQKGATIFNNKLIEELKLLQ
ncbi:hypothetical protein [Dokdonia pacifica]|nr:hypothetical protein [Dokdonia pacifica]